MTDLIFYFGSILIIFAFTGLVSIKFRNEDSINLSKHSWILFVYILLMILGIITWRIIYLLLISSTQSAIEYNNLIQSSING
jgi:uncharacterized membrane protein YeiB